MKCEDAKRYVPLFLYGELSFDEEEAFELHLDGCAACAEELAREKALHRVLSGVEVAPSSELLANCRQELRRRLANAEPVRSGLFSRIKEAFTIRLHPAPAVTHPVLALAFIGMGFIASRTIPFGGSNGATTAGIFSPQTSRVRFVQSAPSGQVHIVLDETRERVLLGRLEDRSIQQLLLAATKDPSDPGLRVESVNLLKDKCDSAEVRHALLSSLQHDPNAGVRLKALEALKAFAGDPEMRKTLTQVLLRDDNPGVRTQVIDLLIQHKTEDMVGAFQELMCREDNGYIRMRCEKALKEMNASVETF